jgi:hypothetical protein
VAESDGHHGAGDRAVHLAGHVKRKGDEVDGRHDQVELAHHEGCEDQVLGDVQAGIGGRKKAQKQGEREADEQM